MGNLLIQWGLSADTNKNAPKKPDNKSGIFALINTIYFKVFF